MCLSESMYPNFEYPLTMINKSSHRRCSVKRCSKKFPGIHRKTPVPESLINKVAS